MNPSSVNRSQLLQNLPHFLVLCSLVALGVVSRLWIEIPNFKPIAAIGLFAGFYFSRTWWSVFAVLALMMCSDLILGSYEPIVMLSVYACMLAAVACGRCGKRAFASQQESIDPESSAGDSNGRSRLVPRHAIRTYAKGLAARMAAVATASVLAAVVFFLITNLAVWYGTDWYPRNGSGLATCYLAAVPFFKYSLAGNLFFSLGLFGTYELARVVLAATVRPESIHGRAADSISQ